MLKKKYIYIGIFVILITIFIIFIPTIVAPPYSFDISEDHKIISFYSGGDLIVKATILNDLEHNYIPVGENQVVFSISIENYGNPLPNFFNNLKIINMKTGEEENKPYHWVYGIYGDVEVPTYGETCRYIMNDSKLWEECTIGQIGTHIENQIIEWKNFTTNKIETGNIIVGLMTDTVEGDHYDGIPTILSREIIEWLTWDVVVVDAHGVAPTNSDADSGYWGLRIRTKCGGGKQLRIVNFGIFPQSTQSPMCGVGYNTSAVDDSPLPVNVKNGTLRVGRDCSFTSDYAILNDNFVYGIWTWQTNGVAATHRTKYTNSWPISGTNINWIGSVVPTPSYKGWSNNPANMVYGPTEIVNITTQCEILVTDTCTYSSGAWLVNCSDNCTISSPVIGTGNTNFTITGKEGTFVINANITNFRWYRLLPQDMCNITCRNGSCFGVDN